VSDEISDGKGKIWLNGQWVPESSGDAISLRDQLKNNLIPSQPNNIQVPPQPNNNKNPSPKKKSSLEIFSTIGVIFAAIFSVFKFFNSISGTSDNYQSNGRYQCISGHIENSTHWGGPRKCSICGKTMSWKS